jgi:ligand-binding sensor domain-containing protein
MIAKSSLGLVTLACVFCVATVSVTAQTQNLERVVMPMELPSGEAGGLEKNSTITYLSLQSEGLYILTERKGCYLIPEMPANALQLVAEPTDRREVFNALVETNRGAYLLINYRELLPLGRAESSRINFTTSFFSSVVKPTAVHVSADGTIVVGSEQDGLFVFRTDEYGGYTNVPNRVSTVGKQLPSNVIRVIYEDQHGVVWIGTDAGLATMVGDTIYNLGRSPERKKTWLQRFLGTGDIPPVYDGKVTTITQWGDQMVFSDGAQIFAIRNRPDSLAAVYRYHFEEKELPLPLSEVKKLSVDINGDLWIVGNQLLRYNITTDRVKVFNREGVFRGQEILAILEDLDQGKIWLGTRRGGLFFLNADAEFDPYRRIGH